MSDWLAKRVDSEQELKIADALLHKADALLRRHRGIEPAEPEVEVPLDDEDLPILTEVVEDFDATVAPPAVPAPASTDACGPAAATELAEHMVALDTAIQREVEAWFAQELPLLLSREFERLSGQLREEALAHLRATLLPALSERISHSLDKISGPER